MNKKFFLLLSACAIFVSFMAGAWPRLSGSKKAAINLAVPEHTFINRFDPPIQDLEVPVEAPGQIKSLSKARVVSPVINPQNNSVVYYEKNTGRVLESAIATRKESVVSDHQLPDLIRTHWSPARDVVISEFASRTGIDFRYFNYTTRKSSSLGGLYSLAFSPDGNYVTYLAKDSGIGYIMIAQPDGIAGKTLIKTRLQNLSLYWPAPNLIYFVSQNDTDQSWEVFSLNMSGELNKVLAEKKDLELLFSKDGRYLLYSSTDKKEGLVLSYLDVTSGKESSLPIATGASKCAWTLDSQKIICGIPSSALSQDPVFGPSVSDDIYEFSIANGTRKRVSIKDSANLRIQELLLSPLEDYLVLINGFDGKLYSIKRETN